MPIIYLINTIYNRGTLFYKQVRLGQDSKAFEIIKFRTMVKMLKNMGPNGQ